MYSFSWRRLGGLAGRVEEAAELGARDEKPSRREFLTWLNFWLSSDFQII